MSGKISCLMATYGRYSRVCEALACFLAQDYEDRELVILNNHHVPLYFDHPLVKIINEPGHETLGHCRQRLLDFADGEFLRTWDDDDLYTPWAISQGVEAIGNGEAWKPTRSWATDGPETFHLRHNAFEASTTWRTDFVKRYGYQLTAGDEHKLLLRAANMATDEVGYWASYVYRWGCGEWHISGSLGSGTVADRTYTWIQNNQDVRRDQPLVPANLLPWWRKLVRQVPAELQNAWMAAALGVGPVGAPPTQLRISNIGDVVARSVAGERIVATTGCFDVLHEGHREFLRWASQQGSELVVLVNDDDGVAAQKGPERPLVPFSGRVAAVATLAHFVIPLNGVNDLSMLERINPAVFVKGPDYLGREDSIPRPAGCELRIAPPNDFALHTSDLL